MKIKLNHKIITIPEGITIFQAAGMEGISIPTMCYSEGNHNHPSCMICVVKDAKSGKLLPSCATMAGDGMEILTDDEEVFDARKEALELLMSDHVGDCEAPCRIACPAFMDIPKMNRLIAAGIFDEALQVVKEEIALPLILGYICDAPCEKVCRRATVDEAVSICQLKKFVAAHDYKKSSIWFPEKKLSSGKKVAIIGSGPAGLACAFHLTKSGHKAIIYDKEPGAGGALLKIPQDQLPLECLQTEINWLENFGVEFRLGAPITQGIFDFKLAAEYDAVVLATGASESNVRHFPELEYHDTGLIADPETFETRYPGVFACGSIIREQKMAVKALAQGKAAAISVSAFLNGEKPKMQIRKFNSKFGKLNQEEVAEYLKESIKGKRMEPVAGRLEGYAEKEAKTEAKRCMHCDCRKVDHCKLRDYSDQYNIDRRKYLDNKRKSVTKYFTHQTIVYEPQKCIRCGLCVDIAKGERALEGITFIGRGFNVKIDIPFSKNLEEALQATALKCAELCPTGAISKKTTF
ncbi:MAG: FAD-dependent oxidoreductase [Bacteroidales bacterium]|nr:FAD-dependent oxidoreductase [Bacteroidales bacterium]